MHESQARRGYPMIVAAVANAVDEDVVTINTIAVISGINRQREQQRKRLTLRASYGDP